MPPRWGRAYQLFATLALFSSCSSSSTVPSATADSTATCNPDLWNHVYDPSRLQVVDVCRTVIGSVSDLHANEDGDYDIRVALDPPYTALVNDANRAQLQGHLQIETVCQAQVTVADAKAACGSFVGNVLIPQPSQHISVTGSYVLDTNHGGMEIHPVSAIRIVP